MISSLFLTVAIAAQLPTNFGPPPKNLPQQVYPTIQQAPSKNLPQPIQPTPQQVPSKNLPQPIQPTPQHSYAPVGAYESYSHVRYSAQAAAPCNTCTSATYGVSQARVYQAPVRGKFKQKMKFKGKARGFASGRCGGC